MGVYTLKLSFCVTTEDFASQSLTIESEGQYEFVIAELNDFVQQNTLHFTGELFNCEDFFEFDRAVLLQSSTYSTLGILNNEGIFHGEVTLCEVFQEEELLVTLTFAGDTISEEVRFVRQQNATNEYVLENTLLCEGVPEDLFVTIEDEALLALIKQELGLDENQGITRELAESVTVFERTIRTPNLNLSDIVDNFPNLQGLSIASDNYTNFSQIGALTQLKGLRCVNIPNINAISNLVQLESLYLNNSNITDISALSSLTELRVLYLNDNNIVDISSLSNLSLLHTLNLSNNNIVDISALSSLSQLEILLCENNIITDITALSNLLNLFNLNMTNNNLTDISALSDLIQLRILILKDNSIENISVIFNLFQLTALDLSYNSIVDISALSNSFDLSFMDLSNNNVVDILALSNLTSLNSLYLDVNDINELSPLYDLNGLNTLFLVDNPRLTEAQVNELRERLSETNIRF